MFALSEVTDCKQDNVLQYKLSWMASMIDARQRKNALIHVLYHDKQITVGLQSLQSHLILTFIKHSQKHCLHPPSQETFVQVMCCNSKGFVLNKCTFLIPEVKLRLPELPTLPGLPELPEHGHQNRKKKKPTSVVDIDTCNVVSALMSLGTRNHHQESAL